MRLLTDVMTRPDWVLRGEQTGGIKNEISAAKLLLVLLFGEFMLWSICSLLLLVLLLLPSIMGDDTGEQEEDEEEPDMEKSEQLIEQDSVEQSPISPYRS